MVRPDLLFWFLALAVIGVINVAQRAEILAALNPLHALRFLAENGWLAFVSIQHVGMPDLE